MLTCMDGDHFLNEKGFHVLPSWTQQWQESAQSSVPGFSQKTILAKQNLLYQEVLGSNLHLIGQQALPADLQVACMPSYLQLASDVPQVCVQYYKHVG